MSNINSTVNSSVEDELSVQESNQLLNVHKEILEVVVTGRDFQFALDSLCIAAEGILPNALASIMLFNEDKSVLFVRAAPNVPATAVEELSGLVPGEHSGSCGAAVYKGSPQYVYDTLKDSRWEKVRFFASTYNINACWSMPIKDRSDRVIGSFALSSFENRLPNKFHENLLQTAAYLAGLVLLREQDDSELQSSALYDPLTGLPNRLLFTTRVEQGITRSKRNGTQLAVFFFDLDNFKVINDELGHDKGDIVLIDIATRMQASVREEDTFARFGGDEFVLLVEGFKEKSDLELIAQNILAIFQEQTVIDEREFGIGASVGICLYSEEIQTCRELIRFSDQAMYIAKRNNKKKFQFH